MRARPEPTQLEHLSDASFLGKPTYVRLDLDWKVIARYKHSSLFGLVTSKEGKMFYNIGPNKVLPTHVRLDWKVIARYKQSSLFGLIISNKGKKFYNIDTRIHIHNTLFSS